MGIFRKLLGKKRNKKLLSVKAILGDGASAHKLLWQSHRSPAPREHRRIYRSLSKTYSVQPYKSKKSSSSSSSVSSAAQFYDINAGGYNVGSNGVNYRYRRLEDLM